MTDCVQATALAGGGAAVAGTRRAQFRSKTNFVAIVAVFFVIERIISGVEKINSGLKMIVFVSEKIKSGNEAIWFERDKIISVPETTFFAPEMIVSVLEKINSRAKIINFNLKACSPCMGTRDDCGTSCSGTSRFF